MCLWRPKPADVHRKLNHQTIEPNLSVVLQKRTCLIIILVIVLWNIEVFCHPRIWENYPVLAFQTAFQTDPSLTISNCCEHAEIIRAHCCSLYGRICVFFFNSGLQKFCVKPWPTLTTAPTLNPTVMIRDTQGNMVNKLTLDPSQSLLEDSCCKLCGIIEYYAAFCGTCSCFMHHICLGNILHARLVVCSRQEHVKGNKREKDYEVYWRGERSSVRLFWTLEITKAFTWTVLTRELQQKTHTSWFLWPQQWN